VGWSICGGRRVEAVAAGSDCWELYYGWAGCGGLYKLSCYGSLALVNEEGEASGACADGACVGGACVDGACADGACIDGACGGGACAGGVCVGRACVDGACDIVYGKSPASIPLGNSGFVYIKGPIKLEILLSLNKAKNPLVLI
jgi:hypothetical protein